MRGKPLGQPNVNKMQAKSTKWYQCSIRVGNPLASQCQQNANKINKMVTMLNMRGKPIGQPMLNKMLPKSTK